MTNILIRTALILQMFFLPIAMIVGQEYSKMARDLQRSRDGSIEVTVNESHGYLFDSVTVDFHVSKYRFVDYLNYWWVNQCVLEEVEYDISNHILKTYSELSDEVLKAYIRQYIPFISSNGEMMMLITLSNLGAQDLELRKESLKSWPRAVFDGNELHYITLKYSYSKRTFLK